MEASRLYQVWQFQARCCPTLFAPASRLKRFRVPVDSALANINNIALLFNYSGRHRTGAVRSWAKDYGHGLGLGLGLGLGVVAGLGA